MVAVNCVFATVLLVSRSPDSCALAESRAMVRISTPTSALFTSASRAIETDEGQSRVYMANPRERDSLMPFVPRKRKGRLSLTGRRDTSKNDGTWTISQKSQRFSKKTSPWQHLTTAGDRPLRVARNAARYRRWLLRASRYHVQRRDHVPEDPIRLRLLSEHGLAPPLLVRPKADMCRCR